MALSLYSLTLYLTFFSLPLVATFKGKGTVVLVCMLLIAHGKTLWNHRLFLRENILRTLKSPLGVFVLSFVVWMLLSSFWAPDTSTAFFNALRYLALIFSGVLGYLGVQRETSERKAIFFKAFYGGFIFYSLFFFIEIYVFSIASKLYTNSDLFDKRLFIKGIVTLCFLFWPFLFILSEKYSKISFWKVSLLSVVFLSFILFRARPDAALVGIIIGLVAMLCVYRFPKFPYLIASLLTLLSLSTPWLFTQVLNQNTLGDNFHYMPPSYQHRLLIWEKMSEEALKKPVIGHGIDSATNFSKGEMMQLQTHKVSFDFSSGKIKTQHLGVQQPTHIFSSHPHNGIIQIWVEMGFVGILLMLSILWALTHRIITIKNPRERACLFGFLLFYDVICLVGFGLWQKWIGATIILSLLCFYVVKNHQETHS